jgi:hypothetical protein
MAMRIRRHRKITFDQQPVPIVADAAIGTSRIRNGRLVPLLILDTTKRPDLEEFIRIRQYFGAGDVTIQWGITDEGKKDSVILHLAFTSPAALEVIIQFDIFEQGILVEQALTASALFLQAGREGDRFIHNPNAPKVIVEIVNTGFQHTWDKLWFRQIVKGMKDNGLGRPQAKRAARQYIDVLRNYGQIRIGKP